MATLEKIRNKSGLLIVVIGVALFAFIIGDFLNSSSSIMSNRAIAEVGGTEIDVMDFQNRYDKVAQQYQQQNTKQDYAALQQQVLNQMMQETIINEELEALGINVTDKELSAAMLGEKAIPQMVQFANQFGCQTPDQLHEMIFNPGKYGIPAEQAAEFQNMWLEQEKQIDQNLRYQKFANLLGAIKANNLDAKAMYEENAATAKIAYVKKDFSSLNNDEFPVSTSEIKNKWSEEKDVYKLGEEVRLIDYITVSIAPSVEDNVNAQQEVNAAVEALKTTEGTEGVNNNINFVVNRNNLPETRIDNKQIKTFVTTAENNAVEIVSYMNNEYTIAKLLGTKTEVDSVKLDVVAFQGTAAQRDSFMTVLNNTADLATLEGTAGVMGQNSDAWMQLENANPTLKEQVLAAQTGKFFLADTIQGLFYRVDERKAPVKFYEYASITYKVEPSRNTINKLNNDLNAFLVAHSTDTAFTSMKAQEAGYQMLSGRVSASTPSIGVVQNSRNAVKWAMDADKGEVSGIFGDDDETYLLAVKVADIYKDYTPARDAMVSTELTNKVRNEKKAEALLAQYAGKAQDLAGYAAAMEASIDTTEVTFGQRFIAGLGINESAITGKAAQLAPNTLVGPEKAANSVIVYQVLNVETEGRPYNYEENAAAFNRQTGYDAINYRLLQILTNGKDIKNNILEFYHN